MAALADWNAAALLFPRPGFLDAVGEAGATYGTEPVCVHRTPLLLSAGELRRWRRVVPQMHRLLQKVRSALLADLHRGPESLAAQIGVPLDAIEWASIDPGFPSVAPLARLDAYVVDGVPRFLELNAESPAGMGYVSALAPLFRADPAAAAFRNLDFLDPVPAMIRTVEALGRTWAHHRRRGPGDRLMRDARRRAGPAFSIAIVDFAGVATAPEFELLAGAFRRAGHPTVVAAPDTLRFDGDRLYSGDLAIDLVFRRLLVCDLRSRPDECAALLAAYRAGRVCMVNSLRTALLHNKAIFALLHDPSFPLAASERAFVRCHVPLTLRLDDEVRERVRREPERWVLKPAEGHGGRGVVLGWTTSRAAWERSVDEAAGCIVQERVPPSVGAFLDARDGVVHPRVMDLCPFVARGRLAGFLCRLAEGQLANVSAGGATVVPVFAQRSA